MREVTTTCTGMAWVAFNKRTAKSRGDVGIWHETYLVRAGQYEAIYSGMPPIGLGYVGSFVPASGRKENSRGRVGQEVASVNFGPAVPKEF
jgi:Monooxygenase af470-like